MEYRTIQIPPEVLVSVKQLHKKEVDVQDKEEQQVIVGNIINRIVLIIIFFLSLSNCLYSQLKGRIIVVSDGDSVSLLDEKNVVFKIRLNGIDAPEKKQDFGNASKNFIGDLIYDKFVWVRTNGLDRYGRTIGTIYLNENMIGKSVNEMSLENGMSWHYKKYDKNILWSNIELKAKEDKVGLWKLPNPIPPWSFRGSN
jgi:endonuclease YncB( thermonuclease family)